MSLKWTGVLVLVACAVLASCGERALDRRGISVADDVAAIRSLQASWNEAVEASSVEGYIAVLDPEIELLPTDAPPIKGTEGYSAMLDGVFSTDTFEIEVQDAGTVDVSGDWAYARYDYVIHRTPVGSEEAVGSERKYLDVLRRQADGSWRVYKHIWNYNTPDATP